VWSPPSPSLPWYDFSRQLIEDVLDRWDKDKEVVQLEPEALETLRLACSLMGSHKKEVTLAVPFERKLT
jgi:hypothetical protein